MIEARTYLCRRPGHNRNQALDLSCKVQRSMLTESQQQMEVDAEDIGSFPEAPQDQTQDLKGAYFVLD